MRQSPTLYRCFKDSDSIDLDAVEETVYFSKQKSAAKIKQRASDPSKYVMLREAGYRGKLIPGWIAPSSNELMEQLSKVQSVAALDVGEPDSKVESAVQKGCG
jgi:hypothetical protein